MTSRTADAAARRRGPWGPATVVAAPRGESAGVAVPGPLHERLSGLRTTLDVGGDRLEPAAVERARALLDRTEQRLGMTGEHTVVALAGSTGSGKSSLFNALAGLDLAEVGVRRPTTGVPTACVWGAGADALLDWLAVPQRHRLTRHSALDGPVARETRGLTEPGLVLLDLPDHDSTTVSHRFEVDRLAALVDLLIWVVDPQKYADHALHDRYLRRLAGHESVMLVALNQVDVLDEALLPDVLGDLRRLLAQDGLPGLRVVTCSARRGDGVDALAAVVAQVVGSRAAVLQRAAADLADAAREVRGSLGTGEPDARRVAKAEPLVDALFAAAGGPAVLDAAESGYRRGLARHAGWPFVRWLARLRPDPLRRLGLRSDLPVELTRTSVPAPTPAQRSRVELAVDGLVDEAATGLPPRWADAVRAAAVEGDDLTDRLDQVVAGVDVTVPRPRWWRWAAVAQTGLACAAVVGVLWLTLLAVLAYLQLPAPPTPAVGRLPVPTAMLLVGLSVGLLASVAAARIGAVGARRVRRRIHRDLRAAVAALAGQRIVAPITAVLADHRTCRQALAER